MVDNISDLHHIQKIILNIVESSYIKRKLKFYKLLLYYLYYTHHQKYPNLFTGLGKVIVHANLDLFFLYNIDGIHML